MTLEEGCTGKTLLPLLMLATGVACSGETRPPPPPLGGVREIASPAGERSGEPFLSVMRDGRVLLSWLEAAGDSAHALRFSVLDGAAWSEPRTIATSASFFVNWADFPSILELPDGTLAAHWLERSGPGTYAYDVRIVRSADGGTTWSPPLTPHTDGTQTEHGFVSLFAAPEGGLGAVWLDGRNFAAHADGGHGGGAEMTLRYGRVSADGQLVEGALLDGRTCECCQTDVAVTAEGPVVVYRDRSPDEVRDIAVVRRVAGVWTGPELVHADGWHIAGCPVNGPAVAAAGGWLAVAWFTAADDTARVRLAFSPDGGATFDPPVRVDEGAPAGRVDLLMLDDGSALVSWLERDGDAAAVRLRRVDADGRLSPAVEVASSTAERAAGFPRVVRTGNRLVLAWTDPERPARVRTATAMLAGN